jgi:heme-degrading monooxygenase HmoA
VVTIGMNYQVLAGKEKIFEDACTSVVSTMETIEGHDHSMIYRSIAADESAYLIVSRWESEQAFNAFVSSDAFKKVTNWGKENILSGRPSHTTYQEG